MSSFLGVVNRLLPFATPGTPIYQDLAHLAAICLVLYFAPAIQDWLRVRGGQAEAAPNSGDALNNGSATEEVADHHAIGEVRHEAAVNQPELEDQIPAVAIPQLAAQVEDVDDDEDDDAAPGQAGPSTPRNVGAKKAKSLARKDQRKAYNEFMRSQGDAQRAREAEGAAEREAVQEAERKRRAAVEADLEAKKALEREQKREAEKAEREAEYRRREAAIALVKADLEADNVSDLHRIAVQVGGDVDEEWVEKVVKSSGMTGLKDGVFTMITATGWAARISKQHATSLYSQAAEADINDTSGSIDVEKMSSMFVAGLKTPLASVG